MVGHMRRASDDEKQEIGRRMRAARAYAGFTRQQHLADKIRDEGFGKDAIANWETGNYTRPLPKNTLAAVATACGLPVQFFYMDFGALSLLDEDEAQTLEWWRARNDEPNEGEGHGLPNAGGE